MKNLFNSLLAGLVAGILLIAAPVFIVVILAMLSISYAAFIGMTHHLIHNNWIAIPIDITMLVIIYFLTKTTRESIATKLGNSYNDHDNES